MKEKKNVKTYMYVNGNPTNLVDPDGHMGCVIGAGYLPIWGNYTGPGACSATKLLKSWVSIRLYLYFSMILLNQPDENSKNLGKLGMLIVYYYQKIFPMTPLSEVDKDAQVHDRDGGAFYKKPQGNNAFIRSVTSKFMLGLTPIPTKRMYNKTYDREYKATPDRYGRAKRGVALFNTGATITGDWISTVIGTIGFTAVNQLYYSGLTNQNRYKNLDNPSKWNSNPKESLNSSKFNFKAQIFNVNLLSTLNRLNNWNKISKWRL